jgi:raffinose/stachyose/melibiose transport system permease protein/N-acetylglucosamine transport system permease protein
MTKTKKSYRKVKDEASILTKRTKGEKILYGIVFAMFSLYALTLIAPLLFMIVNSLQGQLEYMRNPMTLPATLHFENYLKAFTGMKMVDSVGREIYLLEMIFNSIWYCGVTIFGSVLMSSFTGYALSKYEFKTKAVIYTLAIFSMTIPVVGTTGSMFKLVCDLKIYNTPFYAIFYSLGGFGFNFLVMYGFFKNVSWSYAEAVFIDGGGHFTVFFKIMLPQASMSILTLAIVAFIGVWNDYMTVLLYLPDYPTLAAGLYRIKLSFTRYADFPSYYAGLVIATVPVIIVFSCFSDTIMNNFSVGGLKG